MTIIAHFGATYATSITHPMLATTEAAHSQQCTVFTSLSMLLLNILRTFSVEHCKLQEYAQHSDDHLHHPTLLT